MRVMVIWAMAGLGVMGLFSRVRMVILSIRLLWVQAM
jgi:hypothetical protein